HGLAYWVIPVGRVDLKDLVGEAQGWRVVPTRARKQGAAREAGHVHADLLDLLPQGFVARVHRRGGLVRGQGLGPPAEVREGIAFHFQSGRIVRSDAEEVLDGPGA